MKQVYVRNRQEIEQLLYTDSVLGVKADRFKAFGGFQLWWFDREHGICRSCESQWSDSRKRVGHYHLDKASKILWKHRRCLYVRSRHTADDSGLQLLTHIEETNHQHH